MTATAQTAASKPICIKPKTRGEYRSKRLFLTVARVDFEFLTSRQRREMLSSIPHDEQEINPTRSARSISNLDVELDVRPERSQLLSCSPLTRVSRLKQVYLE